MGESSAAVPSARTEAGGVAGPAHSAAGHRGSCNAVIPVPKAFGLKKDQILFLFTQMGPLSFIPVGKKSQAEGNILVACLMQVIVWVRPADEAAS